MWRFNLERSLRVMQPCVWQISNWERSLSLHLSGNYVCNYFSCVRIMCPSQGNMKDHSQSHHILFQYSHSIGTTQGPICWKAYVQKHNNMIMFCHWVIALSISLYLFSLPYLLWGYVCCFHYLCTNSMLWSPDYQRYIFLYGFVYVHYTDDMLIEALAF